MPDGLGQPAGFITFTLGQSPRLRRLALLVSAAVVLCFFVCIVYMVSFAQEPTNSAPWLLAVPITGMCGIGFGIIWLTKMASRLGTSFRVAVGRDGLWVGEEFFAYQELRRVLLHRDTTESSGRLDLVLENQLGQLRKFTLGSKKSLEALDLAGEYRQFRQTLAHALASVSPQIEFKESDGA